MRRLANLIAQAARPRLRNPNTAPVAPVHLAAEAKYIEAVAQTAQTLEHLNIMLTNHYAPILRSPLAAATSVAAADALDTIYATAAVQSAAGYASAKHQRLAAMRAHLGEIHWAIASIGGDPASITSEAVIEALRRRAEQLDDEIDDWREDHAAHVAASRARMKRHEPLRKAVSTKLTALVGERDHIIKMDEAENRAAKFGKSDASEFAKLRAAGLSDADIRVIRPGAEDPAIIAAARRQRLAEITPQVEKLRAFSESLTFDAHDIAGIDPFIDAEIGARDGAEPTVGA